MNDKQPAVKLVASAVPDGGGEDVEVIGNGRVQVVEDSPALQVGATSHGDAQHVGLGRALAERATALAREAGYRRLAVISATGTRGYYRKLGFELGELYMTREI